MYGSMEVQRSKLLTADVEERSGDTFANGKEQDDPRQEGERW